MTYKQAFDKITEAYFKDQIKPLSSSFCFCGTLCNNERGWFISPRSEHADSHGYKGTEFVKMETVFLNTIQEFESDSGKWNTQNPKYEEGVFAGMSAALDVLKQIHIERGEIIDEVPEFVKRELLQSEV